VITPDLLPELPGLQLQQILLSGDHIVLTLQTTAASAPCPLCSQASSRVHSQYRRHLGDLPWQGRRVQLVVLARRFFCDNDPCSRKVFTERLPDVALPSARTTIRLTESHTLVGYALGGEAGARLAAVLAMPTSPDTLLRRVRHALLPNPATPRVLGVDDWAFRRGHTYGTILIDLEQRCPIDLLPERSAEALRSWLQDHPGVQIISRDRADDYIRGATEGAPQAQQVADRFPLLRNLHDALQRAVDRHQEAVRQAAQAEVVRAHDLPAEPATAEPVRASVPPVEEKPGEQSPATPTRQQERRSRRLACYEQVVQLQGQGLSQRAIADRLGLDRATVRRYVEADAFPERATRRCSSRRLAPFLDYLRRRWDEGCDNAAQLAEELRAQGYTGSYYAVRRLVARWRTKQEAKRGAGKAAPKAKTIPEHPSARRVAWLLRKEAADLEEEERRFVDQLYERCAELKAAAEAARAFAAMLRERREKDFATWLAQLQGDLMAKELRAFGESLKGDEAAVRAALSLEWSNGQVEGQVNRLKTIKRQRYGRAKFDQLRRQVLNTG
jgi:transposase